eukprot:Polyplicarium_translucidae@DN2939_c0_g1_i4.p2
MRLFCARVSAMSHTMTVAASHIQELAVKQLGGSVVPLTSIWEAKKTVVVLVRRFGCALCHHQTHLLMEVADALKKNDIQLVAIGNGSEAFAEKYKASLNFPGPIYIDGESTLFKALGMPRWSNWKFARWLFSWSKMSHFRDLGKKYPGSDMQGDGHQTGGVLVAGPGASSDLRVLFREYDGMESADDASKFLAGSALLQALGITS